MRSSVGVVGVVCLGLLVWAVRAEFSHADVRKVAVIGAGAGGSSAAYHLRQLLGEEADIFVYEKSARAGGRVCVYDVAGQTVELGGAIYHKDNRLMAALVEEAGLEAFNPINSPTKGSEQAKLGVWDGRQFLFQERASWLGSAVAGLWRYGLAPFTVGKEANRVLQQFLTIYGSLLDLEAPGWNDVEGLLDAMQLRHLTAVSLAHHLRDGGFCGSWGAGKYCDEIVAGLTRVNYGQSMDLNALVGLVALIGSTDDVRAVKGGNYQAMEYAVDAANALFHRHATVTKVAKLCLEDTTCTYSVTFDHDGEEHTTVGLDAVVIAAPLEFAEIEFVGFVPPRGALKKRPYQRTHVTFAAGDLNLEGYFGVKGRQPQAIITPETPNVDFTSCMIRSRLDSEGNKRNLFKIFSRHPLEGPLLDGIIANRTDTFQTAFWAYPVLEPVTGDARFPPFVLDEGVFYVNALESAFSTIETEMIGGLNVAKLVSAAIDSVSA